MDLVNGQITQLLRADSFLKLEAGLEDEVAYLSVLGLNGWTAYVGVMEVETKRG